jgi:hypothetical protein
MREEAARVIKEEGWSKAALNKMHKIDSFLRESQRLGASAPGLCITINSPPRSQPAKSP